MKTIGMIGGMSATSSQIYYRQLCAKTQERLGGLHSPKLLINSLDFAEIDALQQLDDWQQAGQILNQAAKTIENAGADFLILATNTMHKVADEMLKGINLPFLHIADATAFAIQKAGLKAPGLMATSFTMEQDFYTDRLKNEGLKPIIPNAADREITHNIIYTQLCKNIITRKSEQNYIEIANRLIEEGADSLILGCTEIGLLLNQSNVAVPVFDTALIHIEATLDMALAP